MNDYNGGTLSVCDYLIERIKREYRIRTIQQGAYLLVKGIVSSKNDNNSLFNALDVLFDIPKKEKKPQKTQEELVSEFENYLKGA